MRLFSMMKSPTSPRADGPPIALFESRFVLRMPSGHILAAEKSEQRNESNAHEYELPLHRSEYQLRKQVNSVIGYARSSLSCAIVKFT